MSELSHCVVIGLGFTGLSCVKFLLNYDLDIVVMDTREFPPFLSVFRNNNPEVFIKTGGLDFDLMKQTDMIILSPGVDPRISEIMAARNLGIEIVGDIELFARYANAPIVAITGSNGKSTVVTLLAKMAKLSGKNIGVGGNLGTPALDLITKPAPDFYIVELSSFQLETVTSLNAFASVILNISQDHLDRYDSMEAYKIVKSRIFNGDGVMVINCDDDATNHLARSGRSQISFSFHEEKYFDLGLLKRGGHLWLAKDGQPLIAVAEMKIIGKHNIYNALSAIALGSAMSLPMSLMLRVLVEYTGLPHRCCYVNEVSTVKWYNDSKSTNVGATLVAIEVLLNLGKLILIAGGISKKQDFSSLTAALECSVKVVVLLGQGKFVISEVVPRTVLIIYAYSMEDAVGKASKLAQAGDNVLLSPACASFDMFGGYEERGEVFELKVKELSCD
ncbi:MAG: UDP-N-acetylmuramoyl-L-alanine--D-glutamate ligase [Piscirickettsiaceae bacterium]|nr:UDP-N-acetylmuramoyl-L-alanine--D-glutamate ligase [Piscirickettsiaceae bacterium]